MVNCKIKSKIYFFFSKNNKTIIKYIYEKITNKDNKMWMLDKDDSLISYS